jgi:uncharacterized protein
MESKPLDDRNVVALQLGRPARGRFVVSVRCSFGYPQVIQVHPIVDGKPFPTLYWLTCPFLCAQISGLEAEGWVKRLETRMAGDESLRLSMRDAHRRYINRRDAQLSLEERSALETDGTLIGLSGRGIGGISDWTRLKCLHTHVAHALAGRNPIGDLVLAMLTARECSPQQVICSAYV